MIVVSAGLQSDLKTTGIIHNDVWLYRELRYTSKYCNGLWRCIIVAWSSPSVSDTRSRVIVTWERLQVSWPCLCRPRCSTPHWVPPNIHTPGLCLTPIMIEFTCWNNHILLPLLLELCQGLCRANYIGTAVSPYWRHKVLLAASHHSNCMEDFELSSGNKVKLQEICTTLDNKSSG